MRRVSKLTICSLLAGAGLLAWLIGRIPLEGSLVVSQVNLPFIEDLLARERVLSWQGNSSLGGTRIVFKNPVALARVDDLIEADALQKGYWVRIEYKALLPLMSSKTIVNEELGMFGKRP
jgi:hypothetical protein